jgi:FxsC-like protein
MAGLWFFVSYSSQHEPTYVLDFYRELVRNVRDLVGGEEADIGFLAGKDIKLGESWPAELDQALQSCRVFLPLLSPAYLASDYCGREWLAFRMRQAAAAAPDQPTPPLILPVLWTPLDRLQSVPPELSELQRRRLTLGDDYATEGMDFLMRLEGKKDTRETIIRALARELVTAAQEYPLPPLAVPPRIKQLVSPWRQPEVGALALPRAAEAAGAGPRYVQFVFVAGRSAELGPLKRSATYYGNQAGEWKPYLPDLPEDIEWLTQQIALDQRLRCRDTLPPTPDLIKQLEVAEKQNRIVVIVVDTWSLQIEGYQTLMAEYDGRRFGNCVVLVPWNPKDPEVTTQRARLEAAVARVFARIKRDQSPNFLDTVSSFDDFKDTLSKALNRLKLELLAAAPVLQTAEGRPMTQPMLTVAGGPGK